MSKTAEKRVESTYLAETLFEEKLEQAVARAREALLALQHPDGYWCFELEADCTIPGRIHPDDALHG